MTNQLPQIQINATDIRIVDGLYCLNDLHKSAGNESKHQPTFFLRLDTTKALIDEINQSADMQSAVKAVNGGANRGTYVCKELVYAYAMWISPKFHLTVIRTFDSMYNALAIPTTTLTSDQAFQLKKAVEQKCKHNGLHYQTVWNAIKNRFGKASYREIESTDFHEALAIIESIELPQAIEHQALNISDYLNPKVNEIMDYVHGLEHIVFNTTGKYPQRPFNKDEIAKGIIGYCLRNQSIELSFSERGLGFNLVDRTMLRIHDSNIAEHIKNGNVKKQYLDDIIQASVARLV